MNIGCSLESKCRDAILKPCAKPAEPYQKFPRIVTYTSVGPDELPGFDTHILPEMTQNLPGFAHT